MVSVVEHTIAVYFTTLPAPETSSIPLPYSETVYGRSSEVDCNGVLHNTNHGGYGY